MRDYARVCFVEWDSHHIYIFQPYINDKAKVFVMRGSAKIFNVISGVFDDVTVTTEANIADSIEELSRIRRGIVLRNSTKFTDMQLALAYEKYLKLDVV